MRQREIGTGQHAQRAEMVLADPCRVQTYIFGVDRLIDDVGDELVGRARIVAIGVVAEREVAELHVQNSSLEATQARILQAYRTPSPERQSPRRVEWKPKEVER
jgi:hypothetical protein